MKKYLTLSATLMLCLFGSAFAAFDTTKETNGIAMNQKHPIKVVVFDFGGVIGRTNKGQMSAFIADKMKISKEAATKGMHNLKIFLRYGGKEETFWPEFFKEHGQKMPSDWYEKFDVARAESLYAYPGMVEIVKQLKEKGYGPALLSNTRDSQAKIKREQGYYDLFTPALLSNEIGARKPHPQAYQILIDRLQLPPENLLFIDDHPENVEAAKAMGIDGVLFQSPKQLVDELAKRGIHVDLPPSAASFQTGQGNAGE